MIKKILLTTTILFFTFSTQAAEIAVDGKVTGVKMFDNIFLIYMDELDTACSSGQRRVAIKSDHSMFSVVVSSVLMAKATGADVQIVYKDQCTHRSNAWDFHLFWLK